MKFRHETAARFAGDIGKGLQTERELKMTTTETVGISPTVRTSAGLRDALFDELDNLRNGTTNPAKANAVAKLADQVISTVKMELDVQKHITKYKPNGNAPASLGAPVSLGS